MAPHLLTHFEIQKPYQNQSKFNGIYSRNDLLKTKDGAHVISLDSISLDIIDRMSLIRFVCEW